MGHELVAVAQNNQVKYLGKVMQILGLIFGPRVEQGYNKVA